MEQTIVNEQPGDLANLINPVKLRGSIRRLFGNGVPEVIGELLQNAARAMAKHVTITTEGDTFTFADDGEGLPEGLAGFHTLLKLAETGYQENPTIADQDPMGLGLHALLAHTAVKTVTFASGSRRLSLDTARWWDDPAYYTTWYERVEEGLPPIKGLAITVIADSKFVTEAQVTLTGNNPAGAHNPAAGYADLLDITLNGQPVKMELPYWAQIPKPLIETTYQGCQLVIGPKTGDRYSTHPHHTVNWYGQLIEVGMSVAFDVYLHVRAGRPLNPRAPTRLGIIDDDKLRALTTFLNDQLYAFFADPANLPRITPELLINYHTFDRARADQLPIFVARRYSAGDDQWEGDREPLQICRYDDPAIRLLMSGVVVHWESAACGGRDFYDEESWLYEDREKDEPGEWIDDYGIGSFLNTIGQPVYELVCGNRQRLVIGQLNWRPGPARGLGEAYNTPGDWAIVNEHEAPSDDDWKPVTQGPVYTFQGHDWQFCRIDFTVGCDKPVEFLQDHAWIGFEPNFDNDVPSYDEQQESYNHEMDAAIRILLRNTVPHHFAVSDLMAQMPDKTSLIEEVVYLYRDFPDNKTATGVRVRNMAGQTKLLQLYA